MEAGSVEMGKGHFAPKLREKHRVWLTTAVAKQLILSQHKGGR